VGGFSSRELSEMLLTLLHNAAAVLGGDLSPEQRGAALAGLQAAESAKVTALMRYAPETAGGIMSDHFITLRPEQTIQQAQEALRAREEKDLTDVSYLYVADQQQKLLGVVSLRDLVFRKPDRKLQEV